MNSPALPLGTRPQRSGSVILWGQDAVSAESSFLAQKDPGPEPHSWGGLSATEDGNFLSHQTPALQPSTQSGLPAASAGSKRSLLSLCGSSPQSPRPP